MATNAAFRDGYFRTVDLAYQDEQGFLYFVGRLKETISPWEIEKVFKQHSAVLEIAVVGVEKHKFDVSADVLKNSGFN